jgi:RecB family exonuclease
MSEFDFIIDGFKWSFSRLNAYHTCPHMFKLQYIDCEKGIQNFFSDFGSHAHSLLERYAKGELEKFELAQVYEDEYKEKITFSAPPNKYKDLNQSYYDDGLRYFENFDGFDFEMVAVEKQVDFCIDDIEITGFIDLLVKDKEGNLHIIDHKSSAVKSPKTEKAKEYWKQMYLYSIPVFLEYGVYPKQLHINAFREDAWYTIDFDENEIQNTKNWVIDTVNAIKAENLWFPKESDYFCSYICNHRNGNCIYKK